jgi:hypothetical protein
MNVSFNFISHFHGPFLNLKCSTVAHERGDAQGGHVEAPPNFGDFNEMGDGGTSHI